MTWGFSALTVSITHISKYIFIPTLHLEFYRYLFYSGALFSSLVFLAKDFKSSAFLTKIGAHFLMASFILIAFESLIFYFDLPLEAAICSCLGVLILFINNLFPKKNVALLGLGLLLFVVFLDQPDDRCAKIA